MLRQHFPEFFLIWQQLLLPFPAQRCGDEAQLAQGQASFGRGPRADTPLLEM
jgi:hypothetical protein